MSCENECNNITQPPYVQVVHDPNADISIINVGTGEEIYKDGTTNPYEFKTLKKLPHDTVDYGLTIDPSNGNELGFKYNPLRGKLLFVDIIYGTSLDKLRGHEDCSYNNILDAVADAQSGDTIIVYPGDYDYSDHLDVLNLRPIYKSGVNIYCHPGVTIRIDLRMQSPGVVTQDTGIYGYSEFYVYSISTAGNSYDFTNFYLGAGVTPASIVDGKVPVYTLEVNNLHFTVGDDYVLPGQGSIQYIHMTNHSKVNVRHNIYTKEVNDAIPISNSQNALGFMVKPVYDDERMLDIKVTFKTAYIGALVFLADQTVNPLKRWNVVFKGDLVKTTKRQRESGYGVVTQYCANTTTGNSNLNRELYTYPKYEFDIIDDCIRGGSTLVINNSNVPPYSSGLIYTGYMYSKRTVNAPIEMLLPNARIELVNARIINDCVTDHVIYVANSISNVMITVINTVIITKRDIGVSYLFKNDSSALDVRFKCYTLYTNIDLPTMLSTGQPVTNQINNWISNSEITQ